MVPFTIRPAAPEDAETLVELILALAEYENLLHEARPSSKQLKKHLASSAFPRCEAFIAERGDTGEAIGMALFYQQYSTFVTGWGIFLEDLFVRPDFRGMGVGFALLQKLARTAIDRGCERLEWNVLDWNQLALDFYEKLGAQPQKEWITMRLTGAPLKKLADHVT